MDPPLQTPMHCKVLSKLYNTRSRSCSNVRIDQTQDRAIVEATIVASLVISMDNLQGKERIKSNKKSAPVADALRHIPEASGTVDCQLHHVILSFPMDSVVKVTIIAPSASLRTHHAAMTRKFEPSSKGSSIT